MIDRRPRSPLSRPRWLFLITWSLWIAWVLSIAAGCGSTSSNDPSDAEAAPYEAFSDPQRVDIEGYQDDAMEPFLSRSGQTLFFNNRNDPSVNTDLHLAARVDSLTFTYLGRLTSANSAALDGVPTLDTTGTFYFVSTRSYDETLSTIYRGRLDGTSVRDIELVPGVSRREAGIVNFDVEVSPGGETLYLVDARFGDQGPETADLVLARRTADGFERHPDSDEILQNVNTDAALEYAAAISSDGRELFFNRVASIDGGASPAVFRATRPRLNAPFGIPQRVAAMTGFVEGATLGPDDRAVYYHKRENDRFVLYRVTRHERFQP